MTNASSARPVRILPHAVRRIEWFRGQGFGITEALVQAAVRNPERLEVGQHHRWVAQIGFDDRHVLRVVYEEHGEAYRVITFILGGGTNMSQYSKRIEYSPDADILTIQVSQKKVDHAQEAGNFVIHVAEDGEPVLIEILDASDFLTEIWVEVISKGLEPEEIASVISKGIMAALSPNVFSEILREILKRVRHHSLAR